MFASNTLQIPEMLPIKEVSERTGLSYNYLRCLCLRGENGENFEIFRSV